MPPSGLTAGLHNYDIDSPLFSETIFPVFSMTLTMSADNLNLLKGQSTTYHVILDGLNGLPGGAWSGSSDPTDLVGSSELSAAQKAVGTSRTGYITLSVTNASPGVIAMQNQFVKLNAASFAPSGSFKLDGGVSALVKGSFSIDGVARAYLDPEIGIGIPPGASPPTGPANLQGGSWNGDWLPPFSVNYDLAAFSKSPFMTSSSCPVGAPVESTSNALAECWSELVEKAGRTSISVATTAIGQQITPTTTAPASSAPAATPPTPTAGTPATTPPVESATNYIQPPKSTTQVNQAGDNTANAQKLQDAEKRVQEATEKEHAAFEKVVTANRGVESAFNDGLEKADPALQDKLKQAEAALEKARGDTAAATATQDATPSTENENALANAQMDEANAWAAADAAKKEVIESFDTDTKAGYDYSLKELDKAMKDWQPTENEKRAAYDALEKLQQPAPTPLEQVM
jgi:hypothetical protein